MLHEVGGDGLLDAMNAGQAAVTWLGTVGIESFRVAIVCGGRSCNGGGEELGDADGLFEPHTAAA